MDLSCVESNVISLYFLYCSVNGSVVLCVVCLTVFVNCLVKQFEIFLDVVVILLLNILELLSVAGGALLDRLIFTFIHSLCGKTQHHQRLDTGHMHSTSCCEMGRLERERESTLFT